ncbi:MAG: oxidase [Bacteroidia bacterium]
MEVKDIILDDDNDLEIQNGDFVISLSDQQHVVLILNTTVGEWKLSPLTGVGIQKYISSSGQQQTLKRSIEVQLQADGYEKPDVILKGNEVYYLSSKRVK